MIRYNVENATDAFNGLAETLDAISRLPLSRTYSWASKKDRARNIENIANIIDLYPDADRIRAPFERAIEIANTARDEGTATALRKLLADLQAAHEKLTEGEKAESEYKAQLADVAASVRGMLADIAEDGTKRTDTAQPPVNVTAELHPQDRKLLIDTKEAAQRADIQSKRAAANSQAAVDELKQWRKWLAQIKKPGKHKDAPPIPQVMQQAVIAKWKEYRKECKGKRRATFQGCLDAHGADEIYTNALTNKSYQLIELAHNEAELKDIVHNEQAKDSARKNAEKSKSRQKRKRK